MYMSIFMYTHFHVTLTNRSKKDIKTVHKHNNDRRQWVGQHQNNRFLFIMFAMQ